MTLYSYVVARDYAFAPNPFFGVCTLATCKPITRRVAKVGDWIVGTGSAGPPRRVGFLVYVMQVSETLTFEQYWADPRFKAKKPNLRGSKKQVFGDNIYSRNPATGQWDQLDSHHCFDDGSPNPANIANDTQTDRVLIGAEFTYWGGSGPEIPQKFRNFNGADICNVRNHKCDFPPELVRQFLEWTRSFGDHGYVADPLDWSKTP